MRPDNGSCSHLQRRTQKFVVQTGGENQWMSTAPLVDRKDDRFAGLVKLLHQFFDQRSADQRVIDQAEQDSIRERRQAAQRGLDGGQLTFLPVRVDDNFVSFEVD